MSKNQYHSTSINIDAVNELCKMSCTDPDRLFNELGISHLRETGKKWSGWCPVHGGDNISAFNFYPDGDYVPGYWVCRTHHCENKHGKNLIGLIRGLKNYTFSQAVNWLLEFNNLVKLDDVKLPPNEILAQRKANRIFSKLNVLPSFNKSNTINWDRNFVRSKLQIPCEYYLNRGFSKEILDKYDVGYYPSIDRASVPVYNDDYTFCVGFSARSPYERCLKCKLFHNPNDNCPKQNDDITSFFKWRNSKGFECSNYLYNFWFARKNILNTGIAILVEGPGDVWKLEENGINNSVALFGCDIKDSQRIILDGSGALSLVILLDNDEAGIEGAKRLKKQLGRTYRLFFPKISGKDVGDLHSDSITKEIEPLIRRLKQNG